MMSDREPCTVYRKPFLIKILAMAIGVIAFAAAGVHAQLPGSAEATLPGDPFGDDTAFFGGIGTGEDGDGLTAETVPAPWEAAIHGYLETRNQVRTRDGEGISTRQRCWVEIEGGFAPEPAGLPLNSRRLRFFASAALDVDPAAADLSNDHSVMRIHAEEIFTTFDTSGVDVIIGRKMLRWGTGDGINPLDLINPLDHRNPVSTGRADARVPVFLGHVMAQLPTFGPLQEVAIEGVLVPLARVAKLNAPGSAWEAHGLKRLRTADAAGQIVLEDQERPGDPLTDAAFGVRLSTTFSGWDVSLIGFHAHLDSPVFDRAVTTEADGRERFHLTPVHPAYSAVGLNFAKGLDRSTFRGELSVKPDLPVMLADPTATPGHARRTVVEGVFGLDRTFGTNFYVNCQYYYTVIEDADGLARDRFDHGFTYDLHDLFLRDDLEAGVRGIASLSDEGGTFELYADYSLGDDWVLAASLLLFEGSESSRYGQFTENDAVILRVRYSF